MGRKEAADSQHTSVSIDLKMPYDQNRTAFCARNNARQIQTTAGARRCSATAGSPCMLPRRRRQLSAGLGHGAEQRAGEAFVQPHEALRLHTGGAGATSRKSVRAVSPAEKARENLEFLGLRGRAADARVSEAVPRPSVLGALVTRDILRLKQHLHGVEWVVTQLAREPANRAGNEIHPAVGHNYVEKPCSQSSLAQSTLSAMKMLLCPGRHVGRK